MGFIWDISHLARRGCLAGTRSRFPARLCFARQRASVAADRRHLSDDVIRAISERDGVIGLVLYNGFLDQRWRNDRSVVVSLEDQLRQARRARRQRGGWQCVGIGSDLTAGWGWRRAQPRSRPRRIWARSGTSCRRMRATAFWAATGCVPAPSLPKRRRETDGKRRAADCLAPSRSFAAHALGAMNVAPTGICEIIRRRGVIHRARFRRTSKHSDSTLPRCRSNSARVSSPGG